ncbi:MAG: four helix bundle protein [Candidatus Yanofskybacteria bacterium]|nr:four helix bundle protein [Candidatus Yanofskybacteria bacterium]
METYRDLLVWQKAFALVPLIYRLTSELPPAEQFGLVSQMQRASVSIPSNIAEGKKRGTKKDFAQFLRIANGSAAELETQLMISERLYRIRAKEALSSLDEIQRMLTTLAKRLE